MAKLYRVGGQVLVLGLDWPEKTSLQDRDIAVEGYAGRIGIEPRDVRYVTSRDSSGSILTHGCVNVEDGDIPPKALALSVLCARSGKSGVYVVLFQDEEAALHAWACSVNDGVVIRESIIDRDDIRQVVSSMSLLKDKEVFATRGCGLPDATPFSVEDLLAGLSEQEMEAARFRRVAGEANRKAGKLVIIPVLLVVGVLGFMAYRHHKTEVAEQQARQAKQAAIASYLASAPGVIGPLPRSPGWVGEAIDQSMGVFPMDDNGFHLQVTQCTPLGCDAAYFTMPGESFDYRAFADRLELFKSLGITVSFVKTNMGYGAKAHLPLHVATVPVDRSFLTHVPHERHNADDWIGQEIGGALPGKLKGPPVEINLSATHGGAAAGMPPLFVSTVSVDGTSTLDAHEGLRFAALGSIYGFMPVMVEWSSGSLKEASYRIRFEQVNGDAP